MILYLSCIVCYPGPPVMKGGKTSWKLAERGSRIFLLREGVLEKGLPGEIGRSNAKQNILVQFIPDFNMGLVNFLGGS